MNFVARCRISVVLMCKILQGIFQGVNKVCPVVGQSFRVTDIERVLTFRIANLPDYVRKALQTFRIFTTLLVALLLCYPGFFDSGEMFTIWKKC